ncbi:hypothetical protein AAEX63_10050 [Luteococcus sp. H138]|uniref:hypothetical protein n=1 Tax=unclassified Luteococcus TaxID=2639923 RepID=UPI00313BB860
MTSLAIGAPPHRRALAPLALGLMMAAVSLALGFASARLGSDDGILAGELLPPPSHFAVFAFGAGATGMLRSRGHSRVAAAISVCTLVTLIALTLVGRLLGPSHHEGSYRSPDQRLDLRVTTTAARIRPAQRLRLQQVGGLRSRYWQAGCVRGGSDAIESVRWVSPDVVEVTIHDQPERIMVSPTGPVSIPAALRDC